MSRIYSAQVGNRLFLAVAPDAGIAQLRIGLQLRTAGSEIPLSAIVPDRFDVRPAETVVVRRDVNPGNRRAA